MASSAQATITLRHNGAIQQQAIAQLQTVTPQGTIYFDWNPAKSPQQVAPFTGAMFANTGTASGSKRWRGNLFWTTMGGLPCADFQNWPPPPLIPNQNGPPLDPTGGTWNLCCGTFGNNAAKIASYPFTRSHAIGFYVPVGGLKPPSAVTMYEPYFNNVGGQGPFKFILTTTGTVVCDFLGGLYTTAGGYQYNGSKGNAPEKTVARSLKQGAWNYIAWTCRYATDVSGGGQFYYKATGDSAWSLGDAFGGFPTSTWTNTTGAPAPPLGCNSLLNNYEFVRNMSTGALLVGNNWVFDMFYGRVIEGDYLADVQALLP